MRSIRRVLDADGSAPAADATSRERAIEIEASFELGVVHVVAQLWARLGIGQAIATRMAADERRAPHEAALAMAAHRLARPGSKLACHERWLDRLVGLDGVGAPSPNPTEQRLPEAKDLALDQLYRALDVLAEHGDAIETEVFWHSADLFKLDVDLVSYDATTAWFECDEEDVVPETWRGLSFEPLRKRGHSKKGRDNDPQVIVALAVTRDGMPVRSWVLPGDTADVTTVQRIKDDLRQMRLGRALFVGDAGLYAKANLAELGRGAGRYILATPIGRVKEIKDEVLSRPGRYAEITPNLRAKEMVIGTGERRRRYILCLNTEEAEREQRHRPEILELLRLELDRLGSDHPKSACRLVASQRFGPYLSLDAQGWPFIDRAKLRRAEQLDGKFVLTTNDDTLSAAVTVRSGPPVRSTRGRVEAGVLA